MVNRSMPPGRVIPELPYRDVREAAAWLCRAFGFQERLRIADHRVQITVGGDGAVVAVQQPEGGAATRAGGVMVAVADVDRHHADAVAAGAHVLGPPVSYPFGERQYSALDLAGHRSTFSQSVADVHPADWGGDLLDA